MKPKTGDKTLSKTYHVKYVTNYISSFFQVAITSGYQLNKQFFRAFISFLAKCQRKRNAFQMCTHIHKRITRAPIFLKQTLQIQESKHPAITWSHKLLYFNNTDEKENDWFPILLYILAHPFPEAYTHHFLWKKEL